MFVRTSDRMDFTVSRVARHRGKTLQLHRSFHANKARHYLNRRQIMHVMHVKACQIFCTCSMNTGRRRFKAGQEEEEEEEEGM